MRFDPLDRRGAPHGHQLRPCEPALRHPTHEVPMRMLDWNAYRRQIAAAADEVARLSPDTL
jgi:hypothetical protein